jgi:hypothetical protein
LVLIAKSRSSGATLDDVAVPNTAPFNSFDNKDRVFDDSDCEEEKGSRDVVIDCLRPDATYNKDRKAFKTSHRWRQRFLK